MLSELTKILGDDRALLLELGCFVRFVSDLPDDLADVFRSQTRLRTNVAASAMSL